MPAFRELTRLSMVVLQRLDVAMPGLPLPLYTEELCTCDLSFVEVLAFVITNVNSQVGVLPRKHAGVFL